jgi:hypothetical protein
MFEMPCSIAKNMVSGFQTVVSVHAIEQLLAESLQVGNVILYLSKCLRGLSAFSAHFFRLVHF